MHFLSFASLFSNNNFCSQDRLLWWNPSAWRVPLTRTISGFPHNVVFCWWHRENVAETQCLKNTFCSGGRTTCGQVTQRIEPLFTSGGSLMTALHSIRCHFSLKSLSNTPRRAQLQCYWKGVGTAQDQRTGLLRLRGWSSGPSAQLNTCWAVFTGRVFTTFSSPPMLLTTPNTK